MKLARRVFETLVAIPSGRRGKWLVLVAWLVILAAAVPLSAKLTGAQQNDSKAWLPGDAESTLVLDLQEQFRDSDVLPAVVVYERSSGITSADMAKARADASSFAEVETVTGDITGPIPSQDSKAVQTIVPLKVDENDGWEMIGQPVARLTDTANSGADGLTVRVTGPAGFAADSAESFEGIDSTLLFATLAIVIVLLLLTYRSPTLWLLPLLSVGAALTAAQAVIYLLAEHAGLLVNAQSAGILTVLVLGAGTDYALLLVARYREELRRHEDRHEAMALAMRRAAPAILASAATVTLGMLCLVVADLNSTQGLGPVAAIGVVVGFLAMVTLLPALLVIAGRWVFWPVKPSFGSAEPTERGLWARIGRGISRAPRVVWLVTAAVLAVGALGLVGAKADILQNKEAFVDEPASIQGEAVLARHFPSGVGDPVIVIGKDAAAPQLREALNATEGVADVSAPVVKGGYAYFEATSTAPPDSKAAADIVQRIRETVHALPGADAKVGGGTAIRVDTQEAVVHDQKLIIPLVLLVVLVILALLLRAVVAPLILTATVVLSFGAALGVSALMFEHVFGFAHMDSSIPLFVFVFLVALGIDYNIFLMTRVREEAAVYGPRRGALIGLAATGGVITSAGLVLAGTFAALGSLPMVFLAQLGFAVAFGVLLDTIIVRAVLVTALNLDLGRWMWWPGRLYHRGDIDETTQPSTVQPPAGATVGANGSQ
jgi:RND superfamily putative drug exporter